MTLPAQWLPQFVRQIFPPISTAAFAYGSGAFAQANAPGSINTMLDLVFVVDDPCAWHAANLQANASHYSMLRHLGPRFLAWLPERLGAGLYYNTLVRAEGRLIKYGVVSSAAAKDDLLNWTHLYLAGRLHKPVKMIVGGDAAFAAALEVNVEHALTAALLCVPPTFSELDLYVAICRLSYLGDTRMALAENPLKVNNIVAGNEPGFARLYRPLLLSRAADWPHVLQLLPRAADATLTAIQWRFSDSPAAVDTLLNALPAPLAQRVAQLSAGAVGRDRVATWALQQAIAETVRRTSAGQTVLGLLTAGPVKSAVYAARKVAKRFNA